MKKHFVAAILAVVVAISMFSVPAYAESNSATTKAEKAAKTLTRYAEYQGWTAETGKVKISNGKATVIVNLRNSKYQYGNIKVVAKGSKAASYYFKGKKYVLKGWKIALKKYSLAADRKAVLKAKVNDRSDYLKKYAKNRGWTVKQSKIKVNSNRATRTLVFQNELHKWKATVTATRGSGKVALSYKRAGAKSSLKGIKNWLGLYQTSKMTTIDPPEPPADEEADFAGPNMDIDDTFTGEEPMPSN